MRCRTSPATSRTRRRPATSASIPSSKISWATTCPASSAPGGCWPARSRPTTCRAISRTRRRARSWRSTEQAISFFRSRGISSAGPPVLGGFNLYSRRGDFQLDQNGFLVNASGYYLMGLTVDPTTGNATGSIPTTLKFSNNLIPAQQTSQIQYNANLPRPPTPTNTQAGVPGSNLLNPATLAANPLVGPLGPAKIQGVGAAIPPTVVTGTAITFPLPATGTPHRTGHGRATPTLPHRQ